VQNPAKAYTKTRVR